jgi:hypothetical protein
MLRVVLEFRELVASYGEDVSRNPDAWIRRLSIDKRQTTH